MLQDQYTSMIIMDSTSKCKRMQLDRKFVYGYGEENVNDNYDVECRIFEKISPFEFVKIVGNSEIIDIMYYAIKLFSFLENYNYAFSICVFHINKIDSREKKNKCNNKVNIYLFCFIHSFIVIL